VLLCNTDEAGVLAGPGDAGAQARTLTEVARHVIVKRGAAGAVWCNAGGAGWTVGGGGEPMIDPTGAGDAFAAGLLAAWCAGTQPADALAAGAALGAAAVTRVGARPS
jgi:ribokinase